MGMKWGTRRVLPATALSIATLMSACGYQSAYVPSTDRFGVVWRGNQLVMVRPQTGRTCTEQGQWVERQGTASGSEWDAGLLAVIAASRVEPEEDPWDDDDDDDGDGDLAGPAAVVVAVVVAATALTGTALGLALAPAGLPQRNADVLQATYLHNDAVRRMNANCTDATTASGTTPRSPDLPDPAYSDGLRPPSAPAPMQLDQQEPRAQEGDQ